jgi:hypothetical protein
MERGRGLTISLAMATAVYFHLSGLPIFSVAVPAAGLILGILSVERAVQQSRHRPPFSDYVGAALGSGALHAFAIVLVAALMRFVMPAPA